MRTIRFLVPLALAAMSLLFLPSVATAEPYPPDAPRLTALRPTIIVDESDTFFGTTFAKSATIQIDVVIISADRRADAVMVPVAYEVPDRAAEPVTTINTDANGSFTLDWTFHRSGSAVVTGTGPNGSASVTITVLPLGASLPVTGENGSALQIALIGSAVAATGVVMVVMVRSRRRRVGTHSD
jgi:hypothetical protein